MKEREETGRTPVQERMTTDRNDDREGQIMPINTIIRDKRKELGLTQEKIAEYLGVSAPAVSKWEKGVSFPDVTLLPPLARLLQMDMNMLFCFEDELTEQEIRYFCNELSQAVQQNGFDSGFELLEKKMREFPRCAPLIHNSALVLDGALIMSGMPADEKERYTDQIIELYEHAAEGGDEKIRISSAFMLSSKYELRGDYKKAREMLDLVPERMGIDKKQQEASIYIKEGKLDEALRILERSLQTRLTEIMVILMYLGECAVKKENLAMAGHVAEAWEKTAGAFELWEYSSRMISFHTAVIQKDENRTVSLLKSIIPAALTPWNMKDTALFRDIAPEEPDTGETQNAGKLLLPGLLSEMEHNPMYDFLQENAEFQSLLAEYKADYS